MWKISVGGGRKHGRKTSTDSVASRGYLSGSEGTISAARGRRSANPPPCPMAATEWMGHGTGSWDSGGPLSHGATVGRLVPTLWGCRSVRSSWGRAGSACLAYSRTIRSGGRGSGQGDLHHGSGCPALGGRPVRGHLPAQGNLRATAAATLPAQSPPPHPCQGGPAGPGSPGKRGCGAALQSAGITTGEHLAWADGMRVGLVSVVRRGWGPGGGEGGQRGQPGREGGYLGVGIEGLGGGVWG